MRYLSPEEVEEAKKMRAQGSTMKAIANHYGVCEMTISKFVRDKSQPRKPKQPDSVRSAFDQQNFEEEDFSKKPDHVLFQHVRVWDFIG